MATLADRPTAPHPFLDGKPKRLLIDGRWVEAVSGETYDSVNPATGELLARHAAAGAEDVDRAVAAARRAFEEGPWSRMKPADRQNLMLKLADLVERHLPELWLLDTLDLGKPVKRAEMDAAGCAPLLRYYAGWATKIHGETIENSMPGAYFSYTLKEPVGVVGAIIPWNGPLLMSLAKIAPVLATGCTMVLKLAEEAALSPLRIGELIQEAGIPDGVVNLVTGFGETAGAALAAHPGVDKVAFTGSHLTGQKIVQASAGNLKRVSLELGGKSPNIVFADADLEAAAPAAAAAIFGNSGQACIAGSRLFVERPVYEDFVARVADLGRTWKIGSPLDPATDLGPVVSQGQLDRVLGYLESGVAEGGRVLSGGARVTEGELAKGYFIPPTVFADVRDDMRIAREEIFGPVLAAFPFDTFEEVVARANATEFGLAGAAWTRDLAKAHRLARAIRAGTVWINCFRVMDWDVPFGGYKMSGYGREYGQHSLDEYLNVKAVWIKTE